MTSFIIFMNIKKLSLNIGITSRYIYDPRGTYFKWTSLMDVRFSLSMGKLLYWQSTSFVYKEILLCWRISDICREPYIEDLFYWVSKKKTSAMYVASPI